MHLQSITTDLVRRLQSEAENIDASAQVRKRLEYLAYYCERGRSVAAVCLNFGIARGTFYRIVHRLDPERLESLEDHPRINPRDLSVITPELVALVRSYREKFPNMGKEKIHLLLFAEHSIAVSSSTVGRIIDREHLYFSAETSPVVPVAAMQPIEHASLDAKDCTATCTCFMCKWKTRWHRLKFPSTALLISIALNILVLGSLAVTLMWESKQGIRTESNLHTAAPHAAMTLDTSFTHP